MAIDSRVPRSRRAILGAALGGAAAVAAASAALPGRVAAHDADDVLLGGDNTTATRTLITRTDAAGSTGTNAAIAGVNSGSSGIGVFGQAAGQYGQGVFGSGAVGVIGQGVVTGAVGLGATQGVIGYGINSTATGVYGFTGFTGTLPAVIPEVGVLARAATTSQTALRVVGKVKFNRSGRTSIGASSKTKAVTMAGVTTNSYVIATLQTHVAGVYVADVVPGADKFTIHLNKTPGQTVSVGYLVIN